MEIKTPHDPPALDAEARAALLRLARAAICAGVRGEDWSRPRALLPPLNEPGAAFVSLHLEGDLRGCIGVLRPSPTLAEAVAHCARAAALEDPRFAPLAAHELARTLIEISVLGALRPLAAAELPRPGVDGVVVAREDRQGLLLPQVAVGRGWSAERFLEETCRKAGLPRDAWRRGALVSVFQAQVFSEAAT